MPLVRTGRSDRSFGRRVVPGLSVLLRCERTSGRQIFKGTKGDFLPDRHFFSFCRFCESFAATFFMGNNSSKNRSQG